MKKRLFIGILIIVTLAVISIIYFHFRQSPKSSFLQIRRAIETHDLNLFNKYVDLQSLSKSLVEQIVTYSIEKQEREMEEAENEWEELGAKMGKELAKGFVNLLKPALIALVSKQIATYVEKGSIELFNSSKEGKIMDEIVLNKFENGKINFTGFEYEKRDNNIALLGVGLFHKEYNTKLVLEVKFRKTDGYWKVLEITNFYDIIKKLDELEHERIEKLNEQITEQINRNLVVESIHKFSRVVDFWGFDKRVVFKINFKNVGDKIVDEYSAIVKCRNENGRLLKRFNVVIGDDLKPGQVLSVVREFDVNIFIQTETKLYDTPSENLYFDIRIPYVKFEDGSELKLQGRLN